MKYKINPGFPKLILEKSYWKKAGASKTATKKRFLGQPR
jgi:hypothetical protein